MSGQYIMEIRGGAATLLVLVIPAVHFPAVHLFEVILAVLEGCQSLLTPPYTVSVLAVAGGKHIMTGDATCFFFPTIA